MRAVIVGIDEYTDPDLPNLSLTKTDARHFKQVLEGSEGRAVRNLEATLLLDREAAPQRILEAVDLAAHATGPDDVLIFLFAGHGVDVPPGLALATSDTRLSDIRSTALLWRNLGETLAHASGKVIVVLDACHSGPSGAQAVATNDDVASTLLTHVGSLIVILAGSKGRQLTKENALAGGGVFTAALTEVMAKGWKDSETGLIDLSRLYASARARVMKATDGRQTPWVARNMLVGNLSLF
jgi:uncharacterized caspase-like protein